MSKKNWWYALLGIFPVQGANNSLKQFGEPWSGLAAGVLVAVVFWGIIKVIQLLVRKVSGRKEGGNES
jgi:hypothetical protein